MEAGKKLIAKERLSGFSPPPTLSEPRGSEIKTSQFLARAGLLAIPNQEVDLEVNSLNLLS